MTSNPTDEPLGAALKAFLEIMGKAAGDDRSPDKMLDDVEPEALVVFSGALQAAVKAWNAAMQAAHTPPSDDVELCVWCNSPQSEHDFGTDCLTAEGRTFTPALAALPSDNRISELEAAGKEALNILETTNIFDRVQVDAAAAKLRAALSQQGGEKP